MSPTANIEDAVILLIRTAALARWPAEVRVAPAVRKPYLTICLTGDGSTLTVTRDIPPGASPSHCAYLAECIIRDVEVEWPKRHERGAS